MLKKAERLTHSEFSAFFKSGKRHHFPHLTIITKPSGTLKTAVVVGKKVARSAVRRNTLRRRIYATLRELVGNKTYAGVIIVMVKPDYNSLARKAADESLRQSIAEVIKKT